MPATLIAPAAPVTAESIWSRYRRTRSPRLRNELAAQNDKLALKIAHRVHLQCPEPVEDLAQIGRIGLLKAIDKYDPSTGAAFSSFAVPYIQGEMQHFLRDHWGGYKVPRRTFEKVGEVKRTQKQLGKWGRAIDLTTAAAAHGICEAQWAWMSEAVQRKPMVDLDNAPHLSAEVEESNRTVLHQALKLQVACLPKEIRTCMIERFFKGLSEEAIAKQLSRSVDEVRLLIQEGLIRLKAPLQEAME
ncbi:sigma-70 family RNA polymerase sigma factor [Phormidium tenue FACHB-886]|nr:sigma-70 family RNA polymerase sigma factor [Phormidium tenue FACHB-886]